MNAVVSIILFFAFTSAEVSLKNGRNYSPTEETLIQERFVVINDGEGVPHIVDLAQGDRANVEVSPDDLGLYLYTRDNPDGEFLSLNSLDDLLNSQIYDPTRRNIFTIHGWRSSYRSGTNSRIRQAIFAIEDINAFAVDWNIPSDQFYTLAVWSIPLVGEIVGNYLNDMITNYNLNASDFYIAGHSLGAHVGGCMGATMNGDIGWIVGLDPAWPMFSLADTDTRLDESDALSVHVAHTNAGFQGFNSSIATADYYFNGGSKQPGCGPDIFNSCAHGRALDYYVESIISSGFRSLECSSYGDFNNGNCDGNAEVYFGGYPLDTTIFGDYHLDTADSSPFALG